MCGIAGIVQYDHPAREEAPRLAAMQRALRHRGPDGEGEWLQGAAALAHVRLAVLDRAGGHQPKASDDGRHVLVYNGEVYRHEALRTELDWPFRTRSDAETVLAACARWGEAAVARLDGMFAFFYWDAARQEGFGARDLLGVKPFVYAHDRGTLLFASEAKAILAGLPRPPRASMPALVEHLVAPFFGGVSQSPFEAVELLPPGGLLRVTREGVTVSRRTAWRPRRPPAPFERGVARVRAALEAAVAVQRVADVPIGAFVSGGLDSTALVALATRDGDRRGPAFTAAFEAHTDFAHGCSTLVLSDDLPFARDAGQAFGLDLHEVPISRATLAEDLRALATTNDLLPAWEQELTQRHLARAASGHVKGVLVGDAADETHAGYRFLLDDDVSPALLLSQLGGFPLAPQLAEEARALDGRYRAFAEAAGFSWDGPAARREAMSFLVVERWLPRLLHNGDIHTMAFGLEARVPFADPLLLEAALGVGAAQAVRAGETKVVLREALRGVVPEEIRTRTKSALPKDPGAQAAYQAEARALLLDPSPLVGACVDLPAVAALCAAPVLSEAERARLFRFIGLAHWADHYGVRPP